MSSKLIIGGLVFLSIIIVVIVLLTSDTTTQSNISVDATTNPTQLVDATTNPTQSVDSTTNPTQSPFLISLVSIEKYDNSIPINLGEIKVYDETENLATSSLQGTTFDSLGQYIQVQLNPPCKVSKIVINNRSQDRINDMVVKTLNSSNNLISKQILSRPSSVHTIRYQASNGLILGYNNGNTICGIDSNQNLLCADENISSNPNWITISDKKYINAFINADGSLYAIDNANNIYYGASIRNPNWVRLSGSLVQIAYNNGLLAGIDSIGNMYYATENIKGPEPNWIKVPNTSNLARILVNASNHVTAIAKSGVIINAGLGSAIVYGIPITSWSEWTVVPNPTNVRINKISRANRTENGMTFVGVGDNGSIWYANNIRNPVWNQVQKKFLSSDGQYDTTDRKIVDVSLNPDYSIYGIASDMTIWFSTSYNAENWIKVNGGLTQISSN